MRRLLSIVSSLAVIAAIAYLRDPTWLIGVESGLRPWERANDGTRYRWTSGHASFFVPSGASGLVLPLRATSAGSSGPPPIVTITVDDRTRARVRLASSDWERVSIGLPTGGGRRVRRIDIRVDRTQPGERGVELGEVAIR